MIETRYLFDYFSRTDVIEYKSTKLAILYNSHTGPAVWYAESLENHELGSEPFFLQNFGLATMIALTQGSIYRDDVMLIPVAQHPNYHALVGSVVIPGNLPIHERYYQILIFLPNEVVFNMPNILELRSDILRVISRPQFLNDKSEHMMVNLKLQLLHVLQEIIYE